MAHEPVDLVDDAVAPAEPRRPAPPPSIAELAARLASVARPRATLLVAAVLGVGAAVGRLGPAPPARPAADRGAPAVRTGQRPEAPAAGAAATTPPASTDGRGAARGPRRRCGGRARHPPAAARQPGRRTSSPPRAGRRPMPTWTG